MTRRRATRREYDGDNLVVGSDGMPVRVVGHWSKDKHHYLKNYISAFTTAMKDKALWTGLGYIDLFAGPGVCRLRNSDREFPGSPLLAGQSPKPFDLLVFADTSADALQALETRIRKDRPDAELQIHHGDCNALRSRLSQGLPPDHLYLAFIDPTGLHVHFDTIREMAMTRQVDLVICLMDRLDLVRNVRYYYDNPGSNLDLFLGEGSDWRGHYDALSNRDAPHLVKLFMQIYRAQLESIGYHNFGQVRRISGRGPFYLLFFASKHQLGVTLWNGTTSKDAGGQRSMFQDLQDM